jgi:iron(III) transport system permease protein
MTAWRWAAVALLLLLIGWPLALPFLELAAHRSGWDAWSERGRIAQLAGTTLWLTGGTLALALPLGTALAILFQRTDLPGRTIFRFLMILMLFVPLPLFASAWQAALGTGGWLPLGWWTMPAPNDPNVSSVGLTWKPWALGLPAAIWVHAAAVLPWVVLIVGQGLRWVEPELEEDALTAAGPWRVLWHVTLPRCRLAIAAAGLWVALQTATEITITDMFQVRTFAEEVYYQFVVGDEAALARSTAVAIPLVALLGLLLVIMLPRLEQRLPALQAGANKELVFRLGSWRWPCFAAVPLVMGWLVGVPLLSLVWKLGLAGNPQVWQAAAAGKAMSSVWAAQGRMVAESLVYAAAAGVLTALMALGCAWLAVDSRWFRLVLFIAAALAWALPAPVIGLGLKGAIQQAMSMEEAVAARLSMPAPGLAEALLYQGPSPAPILWACLVRYFPFALALFWPVVRLFPPEWRDAARLEGARPFQELHYLIWPLLLPVTLLTTLGVAILSLGEVSAGKLVETPGTKTFAHELFNQMHYGVTSHLAALALILLAVVVTGAMLVGAKTELFRLAGVQTNRDGNG